MNPDWSSEAPAHGFRPSAWDRVLAALRAHGAPFRFQRADQVRARCPNRAKHSDGTPSLVITRTSDRVLMRCFGCKDTSGILAALGLVKRDLYDKAAPSLGHAKTRRTIVARYPYHDRDGHLLAEKVRLDPKGFLVRRPDPSAASGWRWKRADGDRRLGLYRLPELLATRPDVLILNEGEAATERAERIGLAATNGPTGAAWWVDLTHAILDVVADRAVIAIVADRDAEGDRHAEAVATALTAHAAAVGRAVVVKILRLSDVPAGGDLRDWLDAGHSGDELRSRLAAEPIWTSSAAAERRKAATRDRVNNWRRVRREARERSDGTVARVPHDLRVKGALTAILGVVSAGPRNGSQLKAALTGTSTRDTVDEAIALGVATGVLGLEFGPRGAKVYHPSDVLALHTSGRSRMSPEGQSSRFPSETSPSELPVTRTHVTARTYFITTLQRDSMTSSDIQALPIFGSSEALQASGGSEPRRMPQKEKIARPSRSSGVGDAASSEPVRQGSGAGDERQWPGRLFTPERWKGRLPKPGQPPFGISVEAWEREHRTVRVHSRGSYVGCSAHHVSINETRHQ